ncbi:MAG TPA: hypothetical protein G4O07_09240 [Dehalococcoidia bacterium]|nr:hypothetical protein [Dehalococcoidia bacterium]
MSVQVFTNSPKTVDSSFTTPVQLAGGSGATVVCADANTGITETDEQNNCPTSEPTGTAETPAGVALVEGCRFTDIPAR